MKLLGKMWWIFEALMVIVTFLNPFIGAFALFQVIEFFFLIVLTINIIVREKVIIKKPEMKYIIKMLKSMKVMGYIVTPVFLIFNTILDLSIFKVANMQNKVSTPFDLFSSSKEICIILLVAALILNVISAVAYISRMKSIEV